MEMRKSGNMHNEELLGADFSEKSFISDYLEYTFLCVLLFFSRIDR